MQERELKSTRQGRCFSNGSDLQLGLATWWPSRCPSTISCVRSAPEPLKLYDFPLV